MCQVKPVDEPLARQAAVLRTNTGTAGTISATDAIVVALAGTVRDANVLTSDPADLSALAAESEGTIAITAV